MFSLPLVVGFVFPLAKCHYFPGNFKDEYFFEGVSDEFVDWYMNFTYPDETFDRFISATSYYGSLLAGPGVLLMIFHLIVLTRKSMRTSSTNIFLIAITLADLTYQMAELGRYAYNAYFSLLSFINWYRADYCYTPPSYFVFASKYYFEVFRDFLNRCSAWWGLLLTVVRSMAIRSKDQSVTNMLTSVRFGWIAVLTTCVVCTVMPILEINGHYIEIFNYLETGPNCLEHRFDPTFKVHIDPNFSLSAVATVDVCVFQIVPILIVAFFTFILISELMKFRKRSVHMGSERVQTTKINVLVFLLAVCFVFVRGFQAIVTIFSAWAAGMTGFSDLVNTQLPILQTNLFAAHTFLHFIICAGLSSQYRETVRRMFNLERMRVRMRIAADSVTVT